MSRRAMKLMVPALTAIVALVLLTGCQSQPLPTNAPVMPPLESNKKPAATPDVPPAAQVTVKITDDGFVPQKLTVKPNTKVTWKNVGDKAHNVTLLDTMRTSGTIEKGGSSSHLFLQEGTVPYRDSFFATHEGVVFVKK